jgi:hypothetical protein
MSQFVEWFASALTDAGWPRVFTTLISSDEGRLTALEFSEAVQGSTGAISGGSGT